MIGVNVRGLDRNILVEIGLVVLVGLAAKNAILIVEFAKQAEQEGKSRFEAAELAAHTRLRPIVMTSLAFILGVVPLMLAAGAGAEMRQSLGTAVFAGMLGVTLFGLVFTPVFYVLVRRVGVARRERGARRSSGLSFRQSRTPPPIHFRKKDGRSQVAPLPDHDLRILPEKTGSSRRNGVKQGSMSVALERHPSGPRLSPLGSVASTSDFTCKVCHRKRSPATEGVVTRDLHLEGLHPRGRPQNTRRVLVHGNRCDAATTI